MVEFITKGTISFVNFSSFGNDVVAVVSSRDGGYSKGEYASLNMSFFLGDNPLTVAKNRQKFFNSCDLPIERAVGAKQNHGTHIAVVDKTMARCFMRRVCYKKYGWITDRCSRTSFTLIIRRLCTSFIF